ncbi:hypothetical protein, partial [Amycolatopsis sp. CA-126428]|uniref:hypothetical protein n=1 Tax=Amycolatopsis sp. CA-126428 TaxID=2073158 RepID=UPI001E43E040
RQSTGTQPRPDPPHLRVNQTRGSPLHVPDRGIAQFTRKIRNAGSAFAANSRLAPGIGWHLREDYQRLMAGELTAAWAARQLDKTSAASGVAHGTLVRDDRLARRLTSLLPDAVIPDALEDVITARTSTHREQV